MHIIYFIITLICFNQPSFAGSIHHFFRKTSEFGKRIPCTSTHFRSLVTCLTSYPGDIYDFKNPDVQKLIENFTIRAFPDVLPGLHGFTISYLKENSPWLKINSKNALQIHRGKAEDSILVVPIKKHTKKNSSCIPKRMLIHDGKSISALKQNSIIIFQYKSRYFDFNDANFVSERNINSCLCRFYYFTQEVDCEMYQAWPVISPDAEDTLWIDVR